MVIDNTVITVILSGEQHNMLITDVIESFAVNGRDFVVSSRDGSKICESYVASTRSSTSHDFVYIHCDDEAPLLITPEHKIYVPCKKEWIKASDITTSCNVLQPNNKSKKIIDVHTVSDQSASKVHALVVTTSSYFANNILISNN